MIVSVLLVARRSDEVTLATTPRVDPEPVGVGR
jgi:hypothetical protein